MKNHIINTNLDNTKTILSLQQGDEAVFKTIYVVYQPMLSAFATRYVGVDDGLEIVQDVMLWLWENRTSLIPEMQLKSLLYTIVKNKCLDLCKHKKIKRVAHDKFASVLQEDVHDPNFYQFEELLSCSEAAIDALPKDFREAFELNRFNKLTYQEIAEKMGVSSKTIAYRISQSLKLLRHSLKDFLPTQE